MVKLNKADTLADVIDLLEALLEDHKIPNDYSPDDISIQLERLTTWWDELEYGEPSD